MWVRCTPYGKNKIVLFDYDPSRSGEVVKRLFAEYSGFLQVDGYSAYNALQKNEKVIEIGCNMHGRRYFEKAKTIGAKAGQTLAEVGLQFYKVLFDIEEEIREKTSDERHRIRQERAVPIWENLRRGLMKITVKFRPKAKLDRHSIIFSHNINV